MTAELTLDRFPEFFEQVTEHQPFEWQLALVRRLLDGRPPEVIDVPTGLGKTSVLHCWAFALAVGAPVPRRLCFVVDRRVVVDATHGDACDLAKVFQDHAGGVVADVAQRLRALHCDSLLEPLEAVRMRGGVTWDSRWLARPDQAAVVVGTVDQFGSRLLMRGYGVSERMRPIDAALVGLDTWLVIDEAHIAEPLVRTTRAVAGYQNATRRLASVLPLQVTRMSATVEAASDVLRADMDAEAGSSRFPVAAQAACERRDARKPTMLVDITDLDRSSPKKRRASTVKLGTALADLAMQVDPDAGVVGVIANTIAAARAAYERLTEAGEQACLLIGRTRAYERDLVAEEWLARIKVGREPLGDGDDRLFVVATQTIEVGANIDLDALVTECAPLSALTQRFGRVNRIGRWEARRCAIVHAGFAHGPDNDRIYGDATPQTWSFLGNQGGPPIEVDTRAIRREIGWSGAPVDFGLPEARRLAHAAGDGVRVEQPFVPRVIGAHLERWAQTSPAPLPDQSVDPFLHGIQRELPQVSVAWRAAPAREESFAEHWRQWLDLDRPVEWEFVEVPVWELHAFLRGDTPSLPTSDLDWSLDAAPDDGENVERSDDVLGVVYRGPDERPEPIHGQADVSAGESVVLRSDLGGHDHWGWTGRRRAEDESWVPDVADLAPRRKHAGIRLVESVVASFVPRDGHGHVSTAFGPLQDMATKWSSAADPGPPDAVELREAAAAVLDELQVRGVLEHVPGLAGRVGEDLGRPKPLVMRDPARDITATLGGVRILADSDGTSGLALDAVSDDDVLQTSAARNPQTLVEHGDEVGRLARSFAESLGLPEDLRTAVELAGRWHDLGKADPRFQMMLHDGDELAAAVAEQPLAKSGRDPRDPIGTRARQLSGLPAGFRHEAVSGQLVRALLSDQPDIFEGVDVDLVHHLVVSHHGHARPILRPVLDPEPRKVEVTVDGHDVVVESADQLDWDHPSRFESLNSRYGWWGLALLEALVRLADMKCSEVRR